MRWLSMILMVAMISSCGKKEVRNNIPEDEQPTELLKYGDSFYEEGDFESAFIAYGTIVNNFPASREYIDASIGLSKCYGNFENYEREFDILYELLRENLIPTKVPQIYNAIAEFYERSAGISEQLTGEGSSDYQTAIEFYQKAIDYPNSEDQNAKGFAQYKIGKLYALLDDSGKAIETFQATINGYSGSEWALRAEQEMSEIQAREKRRADYEQSGWYDPESGGEETPGPPPEAEPQVDEAAPPPTGEPADAPPMPPAAGEEGPGIETQPAEEIVPDSLMMVPDTTEVLELE